MEIISMNKNLSSTDMLVVNVLKTELNSTSITARYREEILNRIATLESNKIIPNTILKSTLT